MGALIKFSKAYLRSLEGLTNLLVAKYVKNDGINPRYVYAEIPMITMNIM